MTSHEIDVVLDLSRGDCGKGKVSHVLASQGGYTHSLRFNGGGNAGHTIYHKGKKFVTHQVPSGVFHGVRSVIGPGCVINVEKLMEEIDYLESSGVDAHTHLRVAENAHVIQQDHLLEDRQDSVIGTTKTGNGPCYRDKYARNGKRAGNIPLLKPYIIDMYNEFYLTNEKSVILAEGAQGFYLDVDWGDYPYVTSSHCGIGSVLLNGFTHKSIRRVIGVAKAYETYVGAKKFEPDDSVFAKIREVGQEFGATTGRPRQCNWLLLPELIKAAQMNGVDEIIINKVDVLDNVGHFTIGLGRGSYLECPNKESFKEELTKLVTAQHPCKITFSSNPYDLG